MQSSAAGRPERQPTPFPPRVERQRPPLPQPPRPFTSLIGRGEEIAHVRDLLATPGVRLVTLTGPGGMGKTRLAIEVATEESQTGTDVGFLPLASAKDPAAVVATIAEAVDVRHGGDRPTAERIASAIGVWPLLLVLDNFEQVAKAAPQLAELLAACPHLTLLVTSRERLRISGEHVVEVSPLRVPEVTQQPVLAELSGYDAVELFVQRARASDDTFVLTSENAAAVAEICRRLYGLPLAIELAAAWVRSLPPADIVQRLDRSLALLVGGPRDQPPRLQTMRNAIAWSYDLLSPDQQVLFCQLAIFVGGFTIDAAEAIARDEGRGTRDETKDSPSLVPRPSSLDRIGSLVDASLVQPGTRDAALGTRYFMLETIREFGLEQLATCGEQDAVGRRHADYFQSLAEEIEPLLRGPEQVAWLERLETELPNLRAALEWQGASEDAPGGLRLATALWTFWVVRDHVPEGRRWLEDFLAAIPAERHGTGERLTALVALGDLCERQGDYAAATDRTQEALELARAQGDRAGEAAALRVLGNVLISRGAMALHNQGETALAETEFARAEVCLEQSATLAREIGDDWGTAKAIHWLASLLVNRYGSSVALPRFEQAEAAFRRLGDLRQLCMILVGVGGGRLATGDTPGAGAAFAESLTLARQLGYRWWAAWCLGALAELAAIGGQDERAARLLGASLVLREATGEPLRPSDRAHRDQLAEEIRDRLGEAGFAAAWAAGAALSPDAAIDEALAWATAGTEEGLSTPESTPPSDHFAALTPREMEVLRLVAEGLFDKEIAARLSISPRTASVHVRTIMRKLDAPTRTGAATSAMRRGLI